MTLLLSSIANAHFVWILKTGDKVQVHFSESADAPEPELLKNVAAANVWAVVPGERGGTTMTEVKLILADDVLSGVADSKATAIVLAHDYGVVSKGDATFRLQYHAKQHVSPLPGQWSAVNDAERLPLEITPAWKGDRLQLAVTWNGQPAAGVEVSADGCGLDETLTTDDQGLAICEPGTDGLLSVRTKMVEQTSGQLEEKTYDSVRTYSTLTLPVKLPILKAAAHQLPPLSHGITSFGAAIVGDDLYVYGGHFGEAHHYSESGQSNELRRLSLTKQNATWESLEGGPRLTGVAMVEYRGRLYRVGGFTAKNGDDEDQSLWSQASFASYDPTTEKWTELSPLPEGRSSHDAAVIDGKLYVVGGWNMQGPDNTTWHTTALVCDLNETQPTWAALPTPAFQRRAVSLAACKGNLYVMGGMLESGDTTNEVAIFDPQIQTWSTGPTLLGTGMEGFGSSAFAVDHRLIVTTMSGAAQVLNDDNSEWIPAGQMTEARFFHRQLTTADGRVLLVGGASMSTGKTNTVELLEFISTASNN